MQRLDGERAAGQPVSPAVSQVKISPAVHAAVPGRIAKSHVSGYAAAAFQPPRSGAPLQIHGS